MSRIDHVLPVARRKTRTFTDKCRAWLRKPVAGQMSIGHHFFYATDGRYDYLRRFGAPEQKFVTFFCSGVTISDRLKPPSFVKLPRERCVKKKRKRKFFFFHENTVPIDTIITHEPEVGTPNQANCPVLQAVEPTATQASAPVNETKAFKPTSLEDFPMLGSAKNKAARQTTFWNRMDEIYTCPYDEDSNYNHYVSGLKYDLLIEPEQWGWKTHFSYRVAGSRQIDHSSIWTCCTVQRKIVKTHFSSKNKYTRHSLPGQTARCNCGGFDYYIQVVRERDVERFFNNYDRMLSKIAKADEYEFTPAEDLERRMYNIVLYEKTCRLRQSIAEKGAHFMNNIFGVEEIRKKTNIGLVGIETNPGPRNLMWLNMRHRRLHPVKRDRKIPLPAKLKKVSVEPREKLPFWASKADIKKWKRILKKLPIERNEIELPKSETELALAPDPSFPIKENPDLDPFSDLKQEVPTVVGGAGDCWKAIVGTATWMKLYKGKTDVTMPTELLLERLEDLEDNYGPNFICTDISVMPDGDLHIAKCNLHTNYGCPCKKNKNQIGQRELAEFLRAHKTKLVGLDPAAMIEASQGQNQGDIARQEANNKFNEEFKAMPCVAVRLTLKEKAILNRRLGYDVRYSGAVVNQSGHAVLAAERSLARARLKSRYNKDTNTSAILHIGSTMQEVVQWWAWQSHDFYLHMSEDKDIFRIVLGLCEHVSKRLMQAGLPSLISRKGNVTRLQDLNLEDLLELLETSGRRRIILDREKIERKYDVIIFEDVLYDIKEEEFMYYMRKSGAKAAHSILFTPDFMVSEAPESDIYVHDQVVPGEEKLRASIDHFWPEILLASAFVPGDIIQQYTTKLLHKLCELGAGALYKFLTKPMHSGSLLEQTFGMVLEITKVRPIVQSLFEKFGTWLWNCISDTRIAWKSGSGNGYRHSTANWRKWIHERRFKDKYGFVDSEVSEMHGEMWIYDYYLSTGKSPITYTVKLPEHKAVVLVEDVFESFNKDIVGDVVFDPSVKRIPIRLEDWEKIINWALGEPFESLSFEVMASTINRVRGGLRLGRDELVAPMFMNSTTVKSVALSALCYVGQLRSVSDAVESDKELLNGYTTFLKSFTKDVVKYGLTIVTSGMAVPIWFLVKWFLSRTKVHEWVLYQKPPKLITIPGRKTELKPKDLMTGFNFVLPHSSPATKNPCFTCQMYEAGRFSKNGKPEEGQEFICERHELTGDRELVLHPDDITTVITNIRTAIEDHRTLGAGPKLLDKMKKMQEWFEGNTGSNLSHHVRANLHVGGPGVGKSTCYRAMAKALEGLGKNVVILSPFSKLLDDYNDKEVIGWKGLHTFQADTFWWCSQRTNVDVLMVDEVTNIDELMLAAMVIYTGAKDVYLAGDPKQTHLNTEANEGMDPLNESFEHRFFGAQTMPCHKYIWNWRNTAGIVKLLNYREGYKMKSRSTDYRMPKFLTTRQYHDQKLVLGVAREMVFSHASSEPIFGVQSMQAPKENNHSVRSEQGMTHKTTAVAVSGLDRATIEVLGMRCVAISRQTDDLICVAEDWGDPVPSDFKSYLCCRDEDEWKQICDHPWPEIEKPTSDHELNRDQAYLDQKIRSLNKQRKIRIEKEKPEDEQDESMLTMQLEENHGFVDVKDPYITIIENRPLEAFYKKTFANCFFDELEKKLGFEQEIYNFMHKTYNSERSGLNVDPGPTLKGAPRRMLTDKDGRLVWWLEQIEDFAKAYDIAISFTSESNDLVWANDIWLRRRTRIREINLQYKAGHVESIVLVPMPYKDIHVHPYDFNPDGKRWFTCMTDARSIRLRKEKIGPYCEKHLDPSETLIGYKVLAPVELSRPEFNKLTRHTGPIGMRGASPEKKFNFEKAPHIKGKIRAGTDGFVLKTFFDQSDSIPWNNLSEPHVVLPVTQDVQMTAIPEGLIGWSKTKAGKLRKEPFKKTFSFTKGMANVYDGGTMETVSAAQRLATTVRKPGVTTETESWARRVAKIFVEDCLDKTTPRDQLVYNKLLRKALADAKQRNYYKRSEAERRKDPFEEPRIMVANKSQVKYKPPHDPMKAGQALSMPNTSIQAEFVPFFRECGYRLKECCREMFHIDDYQDVKEFARNFTMALADLPPGYRFLIVDAVKFDSKQGPVTVLIEKFIHEELGADKISLEEYYAIRQEGIAWNLLGRLKGKMSGNKPSGLPDTKLGNTLVQAALSNYKYTGVGPFICAVKGDDYLRAQAGIKVNEQRAAEVARYTGIDLVETIADQGSFIGYAVTSQGLIPDIVKRTYKALAARTRDYKHFCEQQTAYRDYLDEMQYLGGEIAAQRAAVAVGGNPELGSVAYSILNSISHMGKSQWVKNVKMRISTIGLCPDSFSPRLI